MDKPITIKQLDVLWNLDDTEWKKPMDFGAWDASHHSGTARRLCELGLVEKKGYKSWARHVYKYRRTENGKAAFEANKHRLSELR